MSTRQVGSALGVNNATVSRDMKSSDRFRSDEPRRDMNATVPNGTVDGPRRGQSIGTPTLMFQMEHQTQQQITDKLNVNQASVSRDLNSNFTNVAAPTNELHVVWMYEIDGHSLDLTAPGSEVFATLVYAPKSHKFHAARKALHALNASYSPELRAWRLMVNDDTIKPLQRLYARTSMALYVIEDGDELSAETFERYE